MGEEEEAINDVMVRPDVQDTIDTMNDEELARILQQ